MIHIIGGAGFIGSRLVSAMADLHIPCRIYDKRLPAEEGFVDVTLPASLKALPTCKTVINLAAEHRDDIQDKSSYHLVNVEGARNVCQYCREKNINQIIFTSSVAVYGFAARQTGEDGRIRPFNEYGESKLAAEAIYRNWLEEAPLERSLVIVRPTVVFGEGNRGNVYLLLKQIAKRRFIMIGSGQNIKSLCYVQNVADFLAYSVRLGAGEHIYNYVDKPDMTMDELVRSAQDLMFDKQPIRFRVPAGCGLLIGRCCDLVTRLFGVLLPVSHVRVQKFIRDTSFSTASGDTDFVPKHSLKDALKSTIQREFLE